MNTRFALAAFALAAVGLVQAQDKKDGDKPSDNSPVFWIYDTKTMAWKEDSEPELVRY